jgi:hypothetical protein
MPAMPAVVLASTDYPTLASAHAAMGALTRLCAATASDENDIEEKNGFLCLAVKDCFEAQARSEASMALEVT